MNCAKFTRVAAVAAVLAWMSPGRAEPLAFEPSPTISIPWESNYGQAMQRAQRSQRLLLIAFSDHRHDLRQRIQSHLTSDRSLRAKAANQMILTSLRTTTEVSIDGVTTKLLSHPAFAEMAHQPGLAIVDFRRPNSRHYGHVVTVYPLNRGRQLSDGHFRVLMHLPPGSLTQRTLIYAVRTHPERPASADGEHLQLLASESEQHSFHQASISVQGHHDWETRFHRINAQLPGDYLAQEVCAESWAGQSLIDAAEDCVASWRQSSGHWGAVRSRHRFFGYDMKVGRNRVWYATGIFARGR